MAGIGNYIDLGNPVSDHPLNQGLASWWLPLSNNSGGSRLFDVKGRMTGTLTNVPVWQTDGFRNPALRFTATSSQYVTFGGYSTATIWTWVFRFRRISTLDTRILAGHNSSNNKIGIDPGSANLFVRLVASGTSESLALPGYTDGNWSCLSVARNDTTAAQATANFAANLTLTNPASGSANWDRLGADNSASFPFDGLIAEARYYNRYLTYAERLAVHDQMVRGNPDVLRRWSRKSFSFAAGGGGGSTPSVAWLKA